MKKLIAAVTLIACSLPMATQAELIAGVKGGIYKPNDSAFDPSAMLSAQLGYEFLDLVAADIAIELEAATTVIDGGIDEQKTGLANINPNLKAEYSAQTIGAYLSARTAGPIYAVGRIGVVKTEVETIVSLAGISASSKFDETGLALGAGVGFSLGVRTELELTRHEVDNDDAYYLSFGAAF